MTCFNGICGLEFNRASHIKSLQSPPSRIILLLSSVVFAVLGLLSCQGKIPNATVSYFLGSSLFVAAAIFSAFLASSFCVDDLPKK